MSSDPRILEILFLVIEQLALFEESLLGLMDDYEKLKALEESNAAEGQE